MARKYQSQFDKQSEFFIAIAKQGIHSFMMLGVVGSEGTNHLLARVGKTNDIDPDTASEIAMIRKEIVSEAKARLADEGIFRKNEHAVAINYQAYSITYDQAVDFLYLIHEIEVKQTPNIPEDKKEHILGLIPVRDDGGTVTFEYSELAKLPAREKIMPGVDHLSQQASAIHISNTCRTTAVNMVEAVLGFATYVSTYFFIDPKYKTTLEGGLPNKKSFYIFPPPPTIHKDLSTEQQKVLAILYKRMEEIPQKNTTSQETREKFNGLKELYKSIAGENKLSANELLIKIVEYENKNRQRLYTKRDPFYLSRLFDLKSTTETMFIKMKKELLIAKQEADENKKDPTVIPPAK